MAMGLNTAKIADWSGGSNFVDPEYNLEANELNTFSHDVQPIGKGEGIASRWGHVSVGTGLPIRGGGVGNDTEIQSGSAYVTGGNDKVVLSTRLGRIFLCDVDTPTITEVTMPGGVTNVATWRFEQSTDNAGTSYIYCVFGAASSIKINASTGVATTWTAPPAQVCRCIKSWKNRMCIAGPSSQPQRIYFSDINNPDSFPANNFIDIKSVDVEDDTILAMEVVGEDLIVFKNRSVWVVFDPVTFENRRVSPVGVANTFATAVGENQVYFIAKTGIYSTDGESVVKLSKVIDPMFDGTASQAGLPTASINDARLAYTNTGNKLVFWGSNQYLFEFYIDISAKYGPAMFHHRNLSGDRPFYAPVLVARQKSAVQELIGVTWNNVNSQQVLTKLFQTGQVGDSLGVANAQFSWLWGMRLRLQGTENKERIRRINYRIRGYTSADSPLNGGVYQSESGADSATLKGWIAPPQATTGLWYRLRARPEAHTAMGLLVFFMALGTVTTQNRVEFSEVEIKYRGGKEH
jgi:hypothetical protein